MSYGFFNLLYLSFFFPLKISIYTYIFFLIRPLGSILLIALSRLDVWHTHTHTFSYFDTEKKLGTHLFNQRKNYFPTSRAIIIIIIIIWDYYRRKYEQRQKYRLFRVKVIFCSCLRKLSQFFHSEKSKRQSFLLGRSEMFFVYFCRTKQTTDVTILEAFSLCQIEQKFVEIYRLCDSNCKTGDNHYR